VIVHRGFGQSDSDPNLTLMHWVSSLGIDGNFSGGLQIPEAMRLICR
jgi:hypothetical protein